MTTDKRDDAEYFGIRGPYDMDMPSTRDMNDEPPPSFDDRILEAVRAKDYDTARALLVEQIQTDLIERQRAHSFYGTGPFSPYSSPEQVEAFAGGQGRTAADVERDGSWLLGLCWIVCTAALVLVVLHWTLPGVF